MAYNKLPRNTPKILRSYGLKVVVVPGWYNRGRPPSTGGLNPVGVLCHHTATNIATAVAAVLRLLIGGRSDLPGPLAQFGLGRTGIVYLIAAGRANHAGEARSSGTVAAGDGNELYWGIEAFNNGIGEKWSRKQMLAYILLAAVLSVEFTKNSHQTVRGHKETSVTGKIDPTFQMGPYRDKVEDCMAELRNPQRPPVERPQGPDTEIVEGHILTRGERVDSALAKLRATHAKGERASHIQAAIAALKLIKPARRNAEH